MTDITSLSDRRRIAALETELAELRTTYERILRWLDAARVSAARALVDRLYECRATNLTVRRFEDGYRVSIATEGGGFYATTGALLPALEEALRTVPVPEGRR